MLLKMGNLLILNGQKRPIKSLIGREHSGQNWSYYHRPLFNITKLRGDSYSSDTEEAEASSENYRQFSQFKWYGVSIIGAILLSLIINYFYQNHLNQRIAELELDLSIHNQNLSMLDLLKQEKTRKEQLVLSAGVNANNFLSFYLDQLGKSVPGAITLNEMTVFPVKGKLKNKRKVEVDQQVIQIMGMTRGNEVLDDWMEQMNRFEWVKKCGVN